MNAQQPSDPSPFEFVDFTGLARRPFTQAFLEDLVRSGTEWEEVSKFCDRYAIPIRRRSV
ncbi:hypothetical protein [Demequina sp.]|uniref:hypothetical protein n=1 Tax=Demequina sp. TaxID=2050685 RepID=UPI003A8606FC